MGGDGFAGFGDIDAYGVIDFAGNTPSGGHLDKHGIVAR